jgi:glycosyltransferase involved in cell wall biosynthesis
VADGSHERIASSTSSATLSVVLFGVDYWPDETGIAPYTTGLAEYLANRGDRVRMIAGMPYYPDWKIRRAYDRRIASTETHAGVTIQRYRQYVPTKQSAFRRVLFEGTFFINALRARIHSPVDVVIGIIPNLGSGALAAIASKRLRAPLVLIVQDLMGLAAAQSGIEHGSLVAGTTTRLERWILNQADAIGVVAEGFRQPIERLGIEPHQIQRIRNWTHIRPGTGDPRATRLCYGISAAEVFVLHAGNMGLKQGLDNVIACARIANRESPRVRFVFVGGGSQYQHLVDMAHDLPNVTFLGHQPEADFPDILAAADVLLLSQRSTVADMSLPSKLTSYFMAGRPVVAAVGADSEAAREIQESSAGTIVAPANPQAMLDAILRYANDPVLAAKHGDRGRAYALTTLTADASLKGIDAMIRGVVRTPSAQVVSI